MGSTEAGGGSRGLLLRALVTRGASGDAKGSGAPTVRLIGLLVLMTAALAISAAPASANPARAVVGTVSNISYTSVHVTGEVDATGFGGAAFQYSTDGISWTTFGEPEFNFSETLEPVVPVDITGLNGGTRYFVRLVVLDCSNGCGALPEKAVSPDPNPEFETLAVEPAAVLKANDATQIKNITAVATGEIERPANPDPAFDTSCAFEYVSDAAFQIDGFQSAEQATCGIEPLTTPGEKKAVEVNLTGLKSATEYHLRLTAKNAGRGTS
jgi:hypothetical protein